MASRVEDVVPWAGFSDSASPLAAQSDLNALFPLQLRSSYVFLLLVFQNAAQLFHPL